MQLKRPEAKTGEFAIQRPLRQSVCTIPKRRGIKQLQSLSHRAMFKNSPIKGRKVYTVQNPLAKKRGDYTTGTKERKFIQPAAQDIKKRGLHSPEPNEKGIGVYNIIAERLTKNKEFTSS